MSEQTRAKPAKVTICDLCGEEIDFDKNDRDSTGHLLSPYSTPKSKTKRLVLDWPPNSLLRKATSAQRTKEPDLKYRRYDFHGLCLLKSVERTIEERAAREQE